MEIPIEEIKIIIKEFNKETHIDEHIAEKVSAILKWKLPYRDLWTLQKIWVLEWKKSWEEFKASNIYVNNFQVLLSAYIEYTLRFKFD